MPETTTTTTPVTMQDLRVNMFASSMAVLGAVGMVWWATSKGKKGRFWWGLGGFLAGGATGRVIDYFKNGK